MNRRVQLALATLVSAFAPLPSARAESPSATLAQAGRTSNEVEQVTVHGSQAGGFSSKAREGDSPREVTDAASLVEPLAGVHVRRLGADDGFATLSIRGSSSTQVAVYLAGVPLTGGADPTLDLATLPLWPGARARVYRSFAPAALGPGSLGGTLVLDPPSTAGQRRTDVWAAAGSFGSRRMRIGDIRPIGTDGSRVMTALSASRSDDGFSYYDPTHDATRPRENAGHAAVSGLVAWSLPLTIGSGAPGRLTVTTLAQARRQHLPGTVSRPTPRQELDSDREIASVELSRSTSGGAWIARAWGKREGVRISDDPRLTGGLEPSHTNDAIATLGGGAGWRGRAVRDLVLETRVDGSGERFAPGSWTGATAPPGATRAALGLASDLEWRAAEGLTLAASGRLDAWADRDANAKAARDEVRPTGHIGAEISVGPVTFASHAGVLSRAPSFVERFGNHGIFLGNATLRPEAAWTVDLGARAAGRTGPFTLRAEVAGFATRADDLIVFVPRGAYGTARPENIGRARTVGAEATLEGRAFGAELRASYTGLATANLDQCAAQPVVSSCDRPPLPGRPEHDVVLDLSYGYGPARVRYGADIVSGIFADLTGTVQVPARVLQSTGLRVDVPGAPGLRVALDIRNLFDVRSVTYGGVLGPVRAPIGDIYEYPLPGRSFLASVRYSAE